MIFKSGVVVWDLHPEVAEAIKTGGVVDQIVRDNHISRGFAEFFAAFGEPSMPENLPRKRQAG